MSHWKTFKSDVLTNTSVETLRTALKDMGVELDTNIKSISNTWGREEVDVGFKTEARGTIALGLKQIGDKMELRGDFYGTGLNEARFMDALSQAYQKHNIIGKLEENRWSVESQEVDADGNIVIEAYQYA